MVFVGFLFSAFDLIFLQEKGLHKCIVIFLDITCLGIVMLIRL